MTARLRGLGIAALFVFLTVLHTWPMALHPGSRMQDGADPRGMLWSLFQQVRNLVADPLNFTDASIFYPFSDTLVVLDHQIGNAVLGVPLYLAGASGVTIFNVVLMATFFLSGLFTFLLVRRLTGSDSAAIVAGCAFAFGTSRVANVEHIHLMGTQWIPLTFLLLHRYLKRPGLGRWLALAAASLLAAASSWQLGIIAAVAIGIVALWTLAGSGGRLTGRLAGLALVAIVCGGLLAPLAMTYSRVAGYWPPGATPEERVERGLAQRGSANVADVVALPVESRAPYASVMARQGGALFPGFVTLLLAAAALAPLFRARDPQRSWTARALRAALWLSGTVLAIATVTAFFGGDLLPLVETLATLAPVAVFALVATVSGLAFVSRVGPANRDLRLRATYAALAAAGFLLALGPEVVAGFHSIGSGLWRLDLLPINLTMRAPARLALLLCLGLAVLAGFGLARLERRFQGRRRLVVVALVLLALNVELAFAFEGWDTVPQPSGVDHWLAQSREPGAVLEFPLTGYYWGIYASQEFYDRRNVDGMGYIRPPEIRRLRLLQDFSPLQIEKLWEHFHPRFLVVRAAEYGRAERERIQQILDSQPRTYELRARDGDDAVYEFRDRGRAAVLYRRWPASYLHESGGHFAFSASLSDGHPRTVGTLTVLLNDRVHWALEGPEVGGRNQHSLPFAAEDLVPGINTFEFRASYRYRQDAQPNEIGSSGFGLAADVEAGISGAETYVEVNGMRVVGGPGYVLLSLDPATGAVAGIGRFDTANDPAESIALAAFVSSLPDAAVVAVAGGANAARELTEDGLSALRALGTSADPGTATFTQHTFVGVKGARPGSIVEHLGEALPMTLGVPERRRVQLRWIEIR